MRRREFITAAGAATVLWPFAAQSQSKQAIIGYLTAEAASAQGPWMTVFVRRLQELGWSEGSTLKIEYRWAEGNVERLNELAAELVRFKVDVIVTTATPPTIASKRATSVIPIVFVASGDPVGAGLVESLARPGGNVTGLSILSVDVASKRVMVCCGGQ